MTPNESLPLRPALKSEESEEMAMSPRSGPKVVSIAEGEPEPIPPLEITEELGEGQRIKQFPTSISSKRLSGRPNTTSNNSSRLSLASQSSVDESDSSLRGVTHGHGCSGDESRQHRHDHGQHPTEKLLSDIFGWLETEKAKSARRHKKRHGEKGESSASASQEGAVAESSASSMSRPRTSSMSSDSSAISLDRLQRIIEDNMSSFGMDGLPMGAHSPTVVSRRPSVLGRRRGSSRKLGGQSSDTEYQDGDVVVPSCDVVLDNSKTISYPGGGASVESSDSPLPMGTSKRAEKERKYWLEFKSEIVRLAHTLRLKGWRRVPRERGGEIEVQRLSGALTNAVYVVSPPKELPPSTSSSGKPQNPKPPPKILLRIYGPQVEHLIDRENELAILKRLARKKIGPRMLGTFTNGRFEEYFDATTLKAEDLRVRDTSKQIAKRMRELHDGIDLLDREREEGPFVWRNWDKWVDRCEEVITYLDEEILSKRAGKGESWRERGLVCGVEWKVFKGALDKYRKWLEAYYKKKGGVESRLVFAHNDTQYGNILRMIPPQPPTTSSDGSAPPPSPLLLPANHHKQLIVIDFEYASANTPGLEFANHFTEWCYNYHDALKPWACSTDRYPTLEQQCNFIRSYVNHRPQFNPRASATPKLLPMDSTTSGMRGGVNEFLLDSRAPGGSSVGSSSSLSLKLEDSASFVEEEKRREAETERQVAHLLDETRIWRLANSAQWVAWGIVQAKVPELDEKKNRDEGASSPSTQVKAPEQQGLERSDSVDSVASVDGENEQDAGEEEEEDEFDYLAYAQDRAHFFWADVVELGIMKREELPDSCFGKVVM
ncbi:choline kinase-like protein [Amylocarpus encephaloides]|uniref:Choline kinase-like protein n=1 Tax=Amylocarpus encephaloides TaxID=45428 RepID=A0A9P7YC42_9HELO|nr:choline kinase-like protein [Amylocarpus encephaloides]